jgi:hypothetical protein
VGATTSPFIFNDAIISLAQSLTEALKQLASSLRRTCDLIEELGRRKGFYLNLAGGSNGRAAGAVFHNAHLPDKLPGAHGAKEDGLAIDFPEYLNGTAENAKNRVRWISLSEDDLPLCEVRASHCSPLNHITMAPNFVVDTGSHWALALSLLGTGRIVENSFNLVNGVAVQPHLPTTPTARSVSSPRRLGATRYDPV